MDTFIGTRLTSDHRTLHRATDAIQSLRRAVSINALHFGDNHVDTAILRNNLAAALFFFRDGNSTYVEESVGLLQTALQVLSDYYSSARATKNDSMDRSTCLENLCICLQSSSQHALAHGYMHELLAAFGATYGADHEKVLGLQLALATKYIAQVRS
ncbi:hypothetical protein DYB34_007511 [Aphanomyces astaci]|uniref:Uncharacterized protein n=1 Tax=Aphanomyces astaci TaxID=112090 RepID=A0A397B7M2_APHAT|nr:hypothetical protein DYB36_003596 [Aphanomyces astaci]RHY73824.1 hypothetical protein DYB34_007511 [Aphanomyces astaci]